MATPDDGIPWPDGELPARMEQAPLSEALSAMAPVLHAYDRVLREQGFSEDRALFLVSELQGQLLGH